MNKVQATLDELQLYIQQKSAKKVDSKPKVVVHIDGIQSEIQESEVKTTDEDISVEKDNVTSDDQIDEVVEITDESPCFSSL